MDERRAAERDLERIRALMERAGRYSNLSGYAAILAGALAAAGAALCRTLGVQFHSPGHARPLAAIWGSVFVLTLAQAVAFTVAHARRRGEPPWSPIARQAVAAMLPAAFMGAAVTGYGLLSGRTELLPPLWMLSYGSSLMGLGLLADWRVRGVAALFLLLGAVALFGGMERGLLMMLVSFGGFHLLLGALVLWKPRP
jgi:hypothetical protein